MPTWIPAEGNQGWNQALSLLAANEFADELQKRGFQRAATSFNVSCKPVERVRVVTVGERDTLDAEITKSEATIVLYIVLDSVAIIENTKTTLAYSYKGSGDLFLPKLPEGKYHWSMNGTSKVSGQSNDLAEVNDVPTALLRLWARGHYLGDEFSFGKSFLGVIGN